MKLAAIDLGTNSFLCLIADVAKGRVTRVHEDLTHLVRLGEKVHETRLLQPGALARAEKSFSVFQKVIQENNCDRVLAVATSAARDVQNANELLALGKKYGIPIQVVTGEMEASLTFTGMALDRPSLDGVVGIDIGGGSTEITRQEEDGSIRGESVDIGCVRATELCVKTNPIPPIEMKELRDFVYDKLSIFGPMDPKEAIAVAGTPCALACAEKNINFDAKAIHGTKLTRKTVQKWAEKLAAMSIEERLRVPGIDRGRADVIVAGAVILDVVGEIIGAEEFTVSILGARYGLALAMEAGRI